MSAAGAPELYAVALHGDPSGWLVTAGSASEAAAVVHGTVPAARDVALGELLAWSAAYLTDVRGVDLTGWTVLDGAPCPVCHGRGETVDEGARIECEACCGTGRRPESRRSAMPAPELVDPDR